MDSSLGWNDEKSLFLGGTDSYFHGNDKFQAWELSRLLRPPEAVQAIVHAAKTTSLDGAKLP